MPSTWYDNFERDKDTREDERTVSEVGRIGRQWGVALVGYTDSLVDEILDQDCYRVRPWLRRHRPGVLDLGANVGVFSLLCHQAGCSRIIAVEPEPGTLSCLRENLVLNEADHRVEILRVAVGWGPQAWLQVTHRPNNEGHHGGHDVYGDSSTMGPPPGSDPLNTVHVQVDCLPFSNLARRLHCHRPRMLKVDIEGAERYVFSEENIQLLSGFDVIVCEVHGTENLVVGALSRAGFDVFTSQTVYGAIVHGLRKDADSELREDVKRGWY